MNLDDFIITKIKEIDIYYLKCPKCGYENIPEYLVKICPVCGKKLSSGHLENIEC